MLNDTHINDAIGVWSLSGPLQGKPVFLVLIDIQVCLAAYSLMAEGYYLDS